MRHTIVSNCAPALALIFAILLAPIARAAEPPVTAEHGMVVSSHRLASAVGAQVLRDGGNAVDAAVATAFALAVVLPSAGNLGGGGFLLHHDGAGHATSFDFRETAPLAATERMFLDDQGAVRDEANHRGLLAVGVPGTVAGLWLAHQRLGSRPWAELVQPAVDLAADGYPASWASLAWQHEMQATTDTLHAATRRAFLREGTGVYAPGETFRQPDLARTLALIRDHGRDGFYTGQTARLLAAFMREQGGLITEEDLRSYQAVERAPVHGTYRGLDVFGMGPPSSGGVALVEMLNILEGYDLTGLGHNTAPYLHLLAETMRRAYADRARYLGDPEANPDQPVARLTSKPHAARLRATIDPRAASPSDSTAFGALYLAPESEETTHLSVVDAHGAAVSLTYTLEEWYGSGLVVPGAGFLLNNEMGDFNAVPGLTSAAGRIGTPPNLVAPGKRMLSSMSPTIVAREGRPVLVIGSPGGRTIINTVLQVVLDVVDHGMDIRAAIDAPRIHHQWLPDALYFEGQGFPPPVRQALADRGHQLRFRSPQGRAMGIAVDTARGRLAGAADARSFDGAAVGH